MSVNQLMPNLNKRKFYFCLYSILFPVIVFLLLLVNHNSGVSCGDACKEHSYYVFYFIQFLILGMAVLNVVLYALSRKSFIHERACYWVVILNCISSLYASLLSGTGMMIIVIIWPAIITIPIQLILLLYIFFKETPQDGKYAFFSYLFRVIIVCIIFLLILMMSG